MRFSQSYFYAFFVEKNNSWSRCFIHFYAFQNCVPAPPPHPPRNYRYHADVWFPFDNFWGGAGGAVGEKAALYLRISTVFAAINGIKSMCACRMEISTLVLRRRHNRFLEKHTNFSRKTHKFFLEWIFNWCCASWSWFDAIYWSCHDIVNGRTSTRPIDNCDSWKKNGVFHILV